MDSTRPWLVGEHNPYSNAQKYSLYPLPVRASGGRLAKILGLTHDEYLSTFWRWNLVNGIGTRWSARSAAWAAMVVADVSDRAPVVMLGQKVVEAFGFDFEPFRVIGGRFVVLPHPSGRNRAWNAPGAADKARDCVRFAVEYWRSFAAATKERDRGETVGALQPGRVHEVAGGVAEGDRQLPVGGGGESDA